MAEDFRSRVPWSLEPSLKEMSTEVGVDFDKLVEGIGGKKSDMEMAEEFGVSAKTIFHLRDHFEKVGILSVMGQD